MTLSPLATCIEKGGDRCGEFAWVVHRDSVGDGGDRDLPGARLKSQHVIGDVRWYHVALRATHDERRAFDGFPHHAEVEANCRICAACSVVCPTRLVMTHACGWPR